MGEFIKKVERENRHLQYRANELSWNGQASKLGPNPSVHARLF